MSNRQEETMNHHTPGPWKGQQHGDEYMMKGTNGERVFSLRDGIVPINADAHLIAAAPILLKTLVKMLDLYAQQGLTGQESRVHDEARAAIALAKGEPS